MDASAAIPGVRLGLVSQDPLERLPGPLRRRIAAHHQTDDALHTAPLLESVRAVAGKLGSADRLIGALEELQVPLGEVRAALRIPGMDGETARNFRDKARMKEIFERAGIPCARHRRVTTEAEAWSFAESVGYPLIVKPTAGSGSRHTFRIEDAAMLRESFELGKLRAGHEMMIEEFVVGEEFSFDSVFIDGRLVWHSINHYSPSPLEVLENPWIQWCVLLPRERENPLYTGILAAAEPALRALGLSTGLSHMEWFRRKNGSVAISEVGARPPGAQFTTLISYAHDTDFYRRWAELMIYDRFDPPRRPYAAGAAFLRAQGRGRIHAIHGLEKANERFGSIVAEVKLPRSGQPTSGTYDGDGYVILRHPETEVVKESLAYTVRTIRVEAS